MGKWTLQAGKCRAVQHFGKCSIIYAELRNDKSNLNAFKAIADELGINFGKGTSLALKMVRIVFGRQSNREFAYARVIKIGFEQKA